MHMQKYINPGNTTTPLHSFFLLEANYVCTDKIISPTTGSFSTLLFALISRKHLREHRQQFLQGTGHNLAHT